MKTREPLPGTPDWRELLKLGEQLVNQTSLAGQRDIIVTAASSLLQADCALYLSPVLTSLPGYDQPDQDHSDVPALVKRALETRRSASHTNKVSIEIIIPLIAQDDVLGALTFRRPAGNGFSSNEVETMEALASYCAVALEMNRQTTAKNVLLDQLALVRSVSFQIANVLNLDELARRITHLILSTFHHYYVAILTLEPGAPYLHLRACAYRTEADGVTEETSDGQIELGQGIVGTAATLGKEIVAGNVSQEPLYRRVDYLPETKSEIALPLKIESRVLGVLDVQSDQPDAFTDIDVMVLRALADSIATAVESARLYTSAERRAEQISTVAEVSRAITFILDLDALLQTVADVIHKRFGYPYVHVFTVHPGRRKIFFQAGAGDRSQEMKTQEVTYDLDDQEGIIPWVARSAQSIIANNVADNTHYRANQISPTPTGSELALPLIFGGEVLGVLDIQSDKRDAFDQNDQALLEALADNIAIALRNAMLYRSEKWRRQVAESLRDVAGLLSSNMELNDLLERILAELEHNLPCDVAAIWLVDDVNLGRSSEPTLRLAAIIGGDEESVANLRNLRPETDKHLLKTLRSDQPAIRSSNEPIGPLGTAAGFPSDYSAISVPLRTSQQPLGVLAMAHHTTGRYGHEARAMITSFAGYAAVAIENARLFASAQEQAWVSTVLLQIAEATQSQETPEDLASTIVRLMPLMVGVRGCALFLWDETARLFSLGAAYGVEPGDYEGYAQNLVAPEQVPAFQQLVESHAPIFISDPISELNLNESLSGNLSLKGLVMLPMLAHADLMGALLVTYDNPGLASGSLTVTGDKRLAIIQGIAQQTAIALENIRLIEAKQEEAYVTAVLLQVAQAAVSMNDLDDVLEAIIHIMPILVGIDCCMIYLWNAETGEFATEHVYCGSSKTEAALRRQRFSLTAFPILDAVWQNEAPLIYPLGNPSEEPTGWHELRLLNPDTDINQVLNRSQSLLMGFPLTVKGDKFGVMLAQEIASSPEFREKRLEILTGIAQQAALAVQNDRLNKEMLGRERLEREFQLAREIQQTFLPGNPPTLKKWNMDVRWRTARQVGGDFYDFFELPENRMGLVIADVSDKGMAAALYMTVTRTLIRATVPDYNSPASVLERVNDLLLINSQNGMFVTTFYAVLDLDTGRLIYANAGHNLPFVKRAQTGSVEVLEKGGMVLGALEHIQFTDHSLTLEPGDCLLMYTDGATEVFSPDGEMYGEERLKECVQNASAEKSADILDAIDEAITEYRKGSPPGDDMTLLALCRSRS